MTRRPDERAARIFASACLTANIRTGHPGKHGKHGLRLRPGQDSLI